MLDNKAPELCRDAIEALNSKCQMVPPNNHRRNVGKRAISTCKENLIRMLIGIYDNFLMSMWDHLIEQTNIIVNLLRQIRVHPIYLHDITITDYFIKILPQWNLPAIDH